MTNLGKLPYVARYIALLRGINVGGNRIIKMADLRGMFEAAGAEDVATYIQSGNVVFTHRETSEEKLATKFEKQIAKQSSFDVDVVLRSGAEWSRMIAKNPFADDAHVHALFLAKAPPADALATVDLAKLEPERCELVARDLYVYLPNGMGRSKLAGALAKVKALAKATARNWRTVLQLRDMISKE